MTTNYPATIDNSITLPLAADNSTPVQAAVVNALRGAIIATESALGVNPAAGYGTVATRLSNLETIISNLFIISLSGDLGGTLTHPLVIGIQGRPISTAIPNFNDALIWNGISWSPASVTAATGGPAAGDLIGTYPSPTVAKIQGNAVQAVTYGSLQDGYILTWVNSAGLLEMKPAPVSFVAGGDLAGTATNQTVTKLTGAASVVTVPSGTVLKFLDGTGFFSTTGTLRTSPTFSIVGRNAGNTLDVNMLQWDGSNNMNIGSIGGIGNLSMQANQFTFYTVGGLYEDAMSINWRGPSHTGGITWDFSALPTFTGTLDAAVTFTLKQAISTTGAGVVFTVRSQDAKVSSAANGGSLNLSSGAGDGVGTPGLVQFQGGGTTRAFIETVFGKGTFGGSGSNNKSVIGPIVGSETTAAGVYLLTNAVAASSSNYVLYGDGLAAVFLNAPSLLHFSIGTLDRIRLDTSGLYIGLNPAIPDYTFDCSHTAVQHFTVNATSAAIQYDAQAADLVAHNLTIQGQSAWGSAVTNKTGGSIFLTPGSGTTATDTPGSVVISLPLGSAVNVPLGHGSLVVKENGNVLARIGGYASGQNYGILWLKDGGAPSTINYNLLSEGAELYINAPGTEIVFIIGGVNYYSSLNASRQAWGAGTYNTYMYQLDFSATSIFHFTINATSAKIQYDAKTSDVAAAALTIQGQNAWGSAAVNLNGGNIVLAPGLATSVANAPGSVIISFPANNTSLATNHGQLIIQENSLILARLGGYNSAQAYGLLWLRDGGAPTGANYCLLSDGSGLYINSPSGAGEHVYTIGGVNYYSSLNASRQAWGAGTYNTYMYQMDFSATSIFHFTINATSAKIQYDAKTSDVAAAALTIQGQSAWGSAITNVNGGNIVITPGSPTSASNIPGSLIVSLPQNNTATVSNHGSFLVQENSVPLVRMGGDSAAQNYGIIWLKDGGSPSTTNYSILSDSSDLYINTSHEIIFTISGSLYCANMSASRTAWGAGTYNQYMYQIDHSATAIFHFTINATSAAIQYDANASGAGNLMTIKGQDAFATSGAAGGDIVLTPGNGDGAGVAGKIKINTTRISATIGTKVLLLNNNSIGGTGQPATQSQDGWIPIKDSNGNLCYIPIWR